MALKSVKVDEFGTAQVFMMPGSSFMNVLAGSLYGSATAVPLVALLSTAGSSGSYWLSRLVVKVHNLPMKACCQPLTVCSAAPCFEDPDILLSCLLGVHPSESLLGRKAGCKWSRGWVIRQEVSQNNGVAQVVV